MDKITLRETSVSREGQISSDVLQLHSVTVIKNTE